VRDLVVAGQRRERIVRRREGDGQVAVLVEPAGVGQRVAALGTDEPIFNTFPERLAVINPFFEGSKPAHIDAEIYRNDAIINADATFYSALREVYKVTRVFEYYTSQSYGPMEQLFLTRMVARGDYNLRLYLIELEDAFRDFEDDYGLPSRRLEIISLKDDILAIPRIDVEGNGAALTQAERTRRFREALADPRRLDRNGYLTIPFSTSDRTLSPLTRNHKIAHVEAEIIGGGQGDLLARIYLRMAGTSRVSALGSDQPIFYTFPERLAVLNPFFEGSKPLHIDPDIYRNRSLFDRPLVNSRWEFVLNMLDEEVNQDMDLRGLDDIRLYVYYNDFTEF